jgi:hypothetical protein
MNGRLRRVLSELRRSERGIALPMALMVTVIAMGFAAVPVVASINAQNGDSHNQGTNEALAAAEAGAELALLRQSGMLSEATGGEFKPCVSPTEQITSGGQEAGWCTKFPVGAEARPKIGEAEYSYQVRPCYALGADCEDVEATETCNATEGKLLVQIISTGYATVGGRPVTRRIELAACAATTETAAEILVKEKIVTLTSEIEVLEEGGQAAWETEAVAREKQITTLTTVKTSQLTEINGYQTELVKLKKLIERLHEEGKDVEYNEVPGETYYETTKTAPPNVWGDGQVVGIEGLVMNNNAQVYNGGAGSNKAVSMVGSANVCGTVRYGTAFTTDNSSSNKAPANCAAGRTASQGTIAYPSVSPPSNIAAENSDSRLCKESACHEGEDPVPSSVWQRGNMSYNASNKQLSINYSSLTLEGTKPYYLCQLVLGGGSSLYAGSGKSITIYFAPPSQCPGLNGAAQLQIANGTYVYADASSGPKFLFVGSSNVSESRIELAGGAKSEQFVIYAPNSKVSANNGIEMTGAIIANTLELGGGASLNKYGTFSAPPAESFLPTTETTVKKEKPPTKTGHQSVSSKELEERVETVEEKIATGQNLLTETESQIATVVKIREEEKAHAGETRTHEIEVRIKELKAEEDKLHSGSSTSSGLGEKAEELSKQSFRECSAEPSQLGEAPDQGC